MSPLPRVHARHLLDAPARRLPVDVDTERAVRALVEDVRVRGLDGVLEARERFDGRPRTAPLHLERPELRAALQRLPAETVDTLRRTADRIEAFARAQRDSLRPLRCAVPGGFAGHTLEPIETAGLYAPGGRYPLPSSVLMTAIPARVAGCREIVLATPSDHPAMLAAAGIAGVDRVLLCGGAHAIAALAFGIAGPPADLIAGPGNRFVTGAKRVLAGEVGIDMLAGPSELLVLADNTADPGTIAADLLAQAEHDPDARPMLAATDGALLDAVDGAIDDQLRTLPTAGTAALALSGGFACHAASRDELVRIADAVAPEHLEIHARDAQALASSVRHAGAVFIGARSPEVLGDYGVGPNHTLPTGRSARWTAGLSVLTFLRARTFVERTGPGTEVLADAARLARLEGLEAHARAAERRLGGPDRPGHEQ